MTKLTDNCPMPFGPHKGTKMANVPDRDLKNLWERYKVDFNNGRTYGAMSAVLQYIKEYGPEHLK